MQFPIEYLLLFLCLLLALCLVLLFRSRSSRRDPLAVSRIDELQNRLRQLELGLKDDFRINREEGQAMSREGRTELGNLLRSFQAEMNEALGAVAGGQEKGWEQIRTTLENKLQALMDKLQQNQAMSRESLSKSLKDFTLDQRRVFDDLRQQHKERFENMERQQQKLLEQTEKKLEQMRETVDEKLQKTLHERLNQSFETVGRQLHAVQEGLGEMRVLAQDVGGLKRVLSNVKMRGGLGEVQLSLLLEQLLAPEQYEANVKTRPGSNELVEFAIKLPGRDEGRSDIWLPIDAKFPRDVYEQLQNAHDTGDPAVVEAAQRNLDNTIRKMARDIREKYVEPPFTTDFGILFLPFEGIFAEVVRKASLLEELQRDHKIIVTGPTTLAAILNSLQMGFRTLAIQRRSSEVWRVLGMVKKEFESFGGLLQKAQHNIQTGLNQLDDVMGKRTRAIQRKLKGVEILEPEVEKEVLPDLGEESGEEE